MTLLAFAAERRVDMDQKAVAAPPADAPCTIDRYLLLAEPTAANPPHLWRKMGQPDRQTVSYAVTDET